MVGAVASRLAGSADIYQQRGQTPINSINFITCHDGFTLNDLVSYNQKHNEANGEGNRDGINENLSWNCGAEGESADPAVEALRNRQVRNVAALLMLSRGVPMFVAGDEVRRTQGGNNNAYCQDNETSWFDWTLLDKHADLLRFLAAHDRVSPQPRCPPPAAVLHCRDERARLWPTYLARHQGSKAPDGTIQTRARWR